MDINETGEYSVSYGCGHKYSKGTGGFSYCTSVLCPKCRKKKEERLPIRWQGINWWLSKLCNE